MLSKENVIVALCAAVILTLAWQDYASTQEQQSPRERAIVERMGMEINNSIACATNAIALQDRLQKAERELEEAKKKLAEISPPKTDGVPPSGN